MQITPHILVIGGHDPSGGAGIQADIETGAALDCRVFSLVTCLTSQNTQIAEKQHTHSECSERLGR